MDDLTAKIGFLEPNPVFRDEEPYAFRYRAQVPVPLTNMKMVFRNVNIRDLRGQDVRLDTYGFEVWEWRSRMQYKQFENTSDIENIYVRGLKEQLTQKLHAKSIDIIRSRVSRNTCTSSQRTTAS